MKIILLLVSLTLLSFISTAQSPQDIAKQELERRGLGDEEVRERLAQRGIDVDAIDINNPNEVYKLEKSLKEVIAELEKEKMDSKNQVTPKKSPKDPNVDIAKNISEDEAKILAKEGESISQAIDDGATLEEAVSEELIDAKEEKLPEGVTYGQDLFRSQNIKLYRQSQDVKPPASYVMGVGDIIAVSIWGYSEEDLIFEVNENGYIKPEGIPRIYLKGIRLGDARKLLLKRFSNYYRFKENEFEVALNYGRTINVNIVGEVYNFGNFNLPAINTAFNALVAAGGPSNIGSVRNITLKRYGQPDRNLDVYKYLLDPSYAADLYLEEDDFIYVPVAEKLVSINGAVIKPNRYELKSNENLSDLLVYTGGLKANANLKNIQITRFENNKEVIIDVNLNDILRTNRDYKLKNGDKIKVFSISGNYKNFVKLGGAIETPGEYALSKQSKVSDLLSKTVLKDDAYLDLAYLKRRNPDNVTYTYLRLNIADIVSNRSSADNVELQDRDELVIYSKSRFIDSATFHVNGSVRKPGEFAFDNNVQLKLSDAIFMAGGLKKYSTDFAYIKRLDINDPSRTKYIRVNIKEAVINPTSDDNIVIAANDQIVTYSKSTYTESFTVKVEGYVKNPGAFKYDPTLSIADVITLAGGLTYNASMKRIDVFRLQFSGDKQTKTLAAQIELDENNIPKGSVVDLQPFDLIVVRPAAEFEAIRTVVIEGEVRYPGKYAIIDENETIASIVERAGGATDEAFLSGTSVNRSLGEVGNISFDLEKAMVNRNSSQNIIVKELDTINIPKKRDLVTIRGMVKSYERYSEKIVAQGKVVVPFVKGKNAKYYIDNFAGGLRDDADPSSITVKYPNGKVKKMGRFLFWRKYPTVEKGSEIVVYAKEKEKLKEGNNNEPVDWNEVLTSAVTQATTILTLLLLVQRID